MRGALVLCYHAVSDVWEADLAVRVSDLERQVGSLLRRGYRAATFRQAAAHPREPLLAVTFDDAYRSVHDHARPVLDSLGAPGSVYAPSAWVDRDEPMRWPGVEHHADGANAREMLCMTSDQLGALRDAGWEVGSHTCSHPRLTTLDDTALARELSESRAALGPACDTIAYPYGDVDDRVAAAARRAGYVAGAALPERPTRVDPMRWPRIGVYPADAARWRFAAKTSPFISRLRRR